MSPSFLAGRFKIFEVFTEVSIITSGSGLGKRSVVIFGKRGYASLLFTFGSDFTFGIPHADGYPGWGTNRAM